jgi:hypothetical protein
VELEGLAELEGVPELEGVAEGVVEWRLGIRGVEVGLLALLVGAWYEGAIGVGLTMELKELGDEGFGVA